MKKPKKIPEKMDETMNKPIEVLLRYSHYIVSAFAVLVFIEMYMLSSVGLFLAIIIAVLLNILFGEIAGHLRNINKITRLINGYVSTYFIIIALSTAGLQFSILSLKLMGINAVNLIVFTSLVGIILYGVSTNYPLYIEEPLNEEANKSKILRVIRDIVLIQAILPNLTLLFPLLMYLNKFHSNGLIPSDIVFIIIMGLVGIFGAGSISKIFELKSVTIGYPREIFRKLILVVSAVTILIYGSITPLLAKLLIESLPSTEASDYTLGLVILYVAYLIDSDNLLTSGNLTEEIHVLFMAPIVLLMVSKLVLSGSVGALILIFIVIVIRNLKYINLSVNLIYREDYPIDLREIIIMIKYRVKLLTNTDTAVKILVRYMLPITILVLTIIFR